MDKRPPYEIKNPSCWPEVITIIVAIGYAVIAIRTTWISQAVNWMKGLVIE